jgi:hypothetical protein
MTGASGGGGGGSAVAHGAGVEVGPSGTAVWTCRVRAIAELEGTPDIAVGSAGRSPN